MAPSVLAPTVLPSSFGATHLSILGVWWVAPNLSCLYLFKRVFGSIGAIHFVVAGNGWVARFDFRLKSGCLY